MIPTLIYYAFANLKLNKIYLESLVCMIITLSLSPPILPYVGRTAMMHYFTPQISVKTEQNLLHKY
jgi:hypothetical protein